MYLQQWEIDQMEHGFLGLGKGRERRQANRAAKREKRAADKDLRKEKKYAAKERRQAGRKEVFAGLFETVKDTALTIAGKTPLEEVAYNGEQRDVSVSFGDPEAEAKAKQQKMIIIGAVVLGVIILIAFVMLRKKTKK